MGHIISLHNYYLFIIQFLLDQCTRHTIQFRLLNCGTLQMRVICRLWTKSKDQAIAIDAGQESSIKQQWKRKYRQVTDRRTNGVFEEYSFIVFAQTMSRSTRSIVRWQFEFTQQQQKKKCVPKCQMVNYTIATCFNRFSFIADALRRRHAHEF